MCKLFFFACIYQRYLVSLQRGFLALIGAVVVAWLWIGHVAGLITLGACVILTGLAIFGFVRSNALDKMALDAKIDSHVELADNKLKKEEKKNKKS